MEIKGNTILITGGATGIGFALTEAFVKAGNKVLICGRRKDRLEQAKAWLPQIDYHRCDVSKKEGREDLFMWINTRYKDLNILVNNAGIQRFVDFKKGDAGLLAGEDEIATNLAAPIHLSALFAPLLMEKPEAAIVNVSSGLGFVPIAAMAVYCATKAGIHSFTVSLRHQLRDTSIKVFELIPPAVQTELGSGTTAPEAEEIRGIPPSVVAAAAINALQKNEFEIAVGEAKGLVEGSKKDFANTFQRLNSW